MVAQVVEGAGAPGCHHDMDTDNHLALGLQPGSPRKGVGHPCSNPTPS